MAFYTIAEVPGVTVSVRGKDSDATRQKALDKIARLLESGEITAELPGDLGVDHLTPTEAPARKSSADDVEDKDPLEIAVRELQRFSLLKIRIQRLKQAASEARQEIDTILNNEPIKPDLDHLEERLKGSFKAIKEFISSQVEYNQAKPIADKALSLLDETLQSSLSATLTTNFGVNLLPGPEVSSNKAEPPEPGLELVETEGKVKIQENQNSKDRQLSPIKR